MSKNNGGPAFPHPQGWRRDPEISDGMSLRDYFAAKAMQGMLANPKLAAEIIKQNRTWISDSAYAWADDMLAAREDKA